MAVRAFHVALAVGVLVALAFANLMLTEAEFGTYYKPFPLSEKKAILKPCENYQIGSDRNCYLVEVEIKKRGNGPETPTG